jgi:hypothetical protein
VKRNLYHLAIQLMSIIFTRFLVDQIIEYGVPMVLKSAKIRRRRRKAGTRTGYAAFRRQGFLTGGDDNCISAAQTICK